ncbi:2-amino-4-hydroxy-6-hydroxymethyldihydropteridine pyrophosphokinase [Staphylococcus schleiferi]|uniref:2-amino-4-hydroxy-6- hydroxymethyldihydropteridine diphosphokinase n=1 Tax=Staphylococcus coagulans TaxID=74706 RepID=UPI00067A2640|nr:2-amino-4-hydroxy-6-hydroxymethyldihydropteridine diphosphokinase [Staphylococcus coagulans]AKS70058.1 2-amino-4-hydroxy-6-hydroxymethyldihydropteridine pyrophosphokinase [Staphylococcus schleiferi]AKS72177.1 2-amino-4-hydroxy-6-hydroxymethyldihydropteridine pyrophosphokinase [Staphylococcus schleiferi]AKS74464.1 2-amino-4-hydroxy-6-hydroxymethyldihydropteridine pyrophosphokinase [Staphylococcus schleiferi]MBA8765190.1 2-amino-4-hydroxy-6-hydroxymethyldihydropteridine diphosphokinase [Staphy
MVDAYLGLGSNIGDRENQLKEAIRLLRENEAIEIIAISPIYETKPVGYTEQPDFLNLCLHIKTELSAQALLKVALNTEAELHRVRKIRWGPRTIDIDILLYGDEVIEETDLIVPHPRMTERAFVMIPLNDIAANVIEPRSRQMIQNIVQQDETVVKYKS